MWCRPWLREGKKICPRERRLSEGNLSHFFFLIYLFISFFFECERGTRTRTTLLLTRNFSAGSGLLRWVGGDEYGLHVCLPGTSTFNHHGDDGCTEDAPRVHVGYLRA